VFTNVPRATLSDYYRFAALPTTHVPEDAQPSVLRHTRLRQLLAWCLFEPVQGCLNVVCESGQIRLSGLGCVGDLVKLDS
jgi:hypothetical protein